MATIAETLQHRYVRGRLLGTGGMGEVFEGHDRLLGRAVALKMLLNPYDRDPVFLARFEREAQAAAGLAHPNIVGVYDIGEQGGIHFMVMERVQGRTLRQLLDDEGALEPERAVRLAVQVCSALAIAHERGIVHRDIKPSNVMITDDDQVKVMDFGIAQAAAWEHITTPSAVLGTAKYISPEHARRGEVDARSDLYSLGVCLYELLTAHAPFEGLIPVAIVYCHVNEPPPPPRRHNPDIPPELEAIVLRALAKSPDDRYQTADDMREDLERVLTRRPVTARQTSEPVLAEVAPVQTPPAPDSAHPGDTWHEPVRPAAIERVAPAPPVPRAPVVVDATVRRAPVRVAAPPARRRGRGRLFAVLGALAGVLAVALVAALFATRPPAAPESLIVPDVRGRRVADAVHEFQVRGFRNLQLPSGFEQRRQHLVVAQKPAPGSRVPVDQEITLTVVRPNPRVRVPAVRGLRLRQAVERLRKAQLEVSPDPIWRADATVERGRVIDTVPSAGSLADSGRVLRLVISLGADGTPPSTLPPGDLGPVASGSDAPGLRDA